MGSGKRQDFFLCMYHAFKFFCSIFHHLFTTFFNPTIDNSWSTYYNFESKNALNFSKDSILCPSQSMTLIFNIWRIKVVVVSSQTFFSSHPQVMSPLPSLIFILWGFCPKIYLALEVTSFIFFHVLQIALAMLSSFTSTTVVIGIIGALGWPTNWPPFNGGTKWPPLYGSMTCIHNPGYSGAPMGCNPHGCGCILFYYIHRVGDFHCHWSGRTFSLGLGELGVTFGKTSTLGLGGILGNNWVFYTFTKDEVATPLTTLTRSQVTGWNPLEGSTKSSCRKSRLGGTLPASNSRKG